MYNIPKLSFFIYRQVKDMKDNYCWIECIRQIRCFYKNEPIFIIDDYDRNDDLFIELEKIKDIDFNILNIHNIKVLENDNHLKGRGELLCFYYYLKLKPSKKAIFLQDNLFILKKFDENMIANSDIRFIYGFIDNNEFYKSLVNNLILDLNEGNEILEYKYKYNWVGCYGVCCMISLDYLNYLQDKYNFMIILTEVKSKIMREVFERLFGLLITYDKKGFSNISFYGLKCSNSYDLEKYLREKEEMIAKGIPYFNYHNHQLKCS